MSISFIDFPKNLFACTFFLFISWDSFFHLPWSFCSVFSSSERKYDNANFIFCHDLVHVDVCRDFYVTSLPEKKEVRILLHRTVTIGEVKQLLVRFLNPNISVYRTRLRRCVCM